MADLILFGGTSEGRELAELSRDLNIDCIVCVATDYGESLLEESGSLRVHTGRLDKDGMIALIRAESPQLVLDATHPYADKVSETVIAACSECRVRYGRVQREKEDHGAFKDFSDVRELAEYLDGTDGVVFSSLGTKEAAALSGVKGASERIWLRVLPSIDGLRTCLEAGFPAKHIICMQGPFSADLNEAMFRACGAQILLTKDTGSAGGFPEKIEAARRCGMKVLVIRRPADISGEPLDVWKERLRLGDGQWNGR